MRRTSLFALCALASLATFACGDSSSSPSGPSGNAGTLNLRITDSPYGSAKAVLVTFNEVTAHRSDGDTSRVPFASGSTRTCDLKKLQNRAEDILGTTPLDTGQYTMLRLVVQSAKLYFDNAAVSATPCAPSIPEPAGASATLPISSGEVKLNGVFTLAANTTTSILIDFDGESSIRDLGNGNYQMTPVVRIVSVR